MLPTLQTVEGPQHSAEQVLMVSNINYVDNVALLQTCATEDKDCESNGMTAI